MLQDLRKERPDEVNILVATNELESFAIKYGKTHITAKKNETVRQDLFGESVFVILLNIYEFASSFILTVTVTRPLFTLYNIIYSTL